MTLAELFITFSALGDLLLLLFGDRFLPAYSPDLPLLVQRIEDRSQILQFSSHVQSRRCALVRFVAFNQATAMVASS
jgi:hypothetical protein